MEIDVFRRQRQAEIAQQAAELEAEAIRTLAAANRDKALAEAAGVEAMLAAQNVISNANLIAQVIRALWPELAPQLPQVLQALAPQPGVIGDAKIYTFANGGGTADLNKLLLSTSGLALINALFEEGKLGQLLAQIQSVLQDRTSNS
ncbi:flotillin domain-containing protein [Thermosynechococcus vestitus]|uniref:Tlr0263 protein n=1 Tax=Thermosynechococcus vestitus (strain NIES-2133 / IAM M-273 / BP-1) TaxID=197221 RepID=Q8DM60_THEVB|nr:flotillin domain-containing protein [Thermosynechococcus vestitus]BAC07816.1 tlr0263 [Thermosynechococcus vestitus BP-1]